MVDPRVVERLMAAFLSRCREQGLPITQQRRLIYQALVESSEHPSPELIYERVRRSIPSISLATVYKNIKTIRELGLLREVSHPGSVARLDTNLESHHHLLCSRCQALVDFYDETLDGLLLSGAVPSGFQIEGYQVQVTGVCRSCQGSNR